MEPNSYNPQPQTPPPTPENTNNPVYASPTIPFQPTAQHLVIDIAPAVIQPTVTASVPTIPQNSEQPNSTSRDMVIGAIIGGIGVLGIIGVSILVIDFYKHTPGTAAVPPTIDLILPLLFVYSGYYYIGGLNAQRIQRKQGGGSLIKKNYQKFRLVELLLAGLIIGCIAYPILYFGHKNSVVSQTTAKTAADISPAGKTALDIKRTELANNLAAAEKKVQQKYPGQVNSSLDSLHVDYTDPATGSNYGFAVELTQPNADLSVSIHAIHIGEGFKCKPDGSGYMVAAGLKNGFAFAIERETEPPICYDFQGTP